MHLGIIGAGVMGELIAWSLSAKNVLQKENIIISDTSEKKLETVQAKLGVKTVEDNLQLIKRADIVLFSVKPQNARAMIKPLAGRFRKRQVILSIMAGVSIATLARETEHDLIVRAMPNIPAKIGDGMTVWTASEAVRDKDKMIAKMIFQAFGLETFVKDEGLIDSATAISGSGPAYIFYVAEMLVMAAKELGFNTPDAHRLVEQTFRGAMNLWHETGESPKQLRKDVTSKGGTTEAALNRFQKHETEKIFIDSIRQAFERAKELREVADG